MRVSQEKMESILECLCNRMDSFNLNDIDFLKLDKNILISGQYTISCPVIGELDGDQIVKTIFEEFHTFNLSILRDRLFKGDIDSFFDFSDCNNEFDISKRIVNEIRKYNEFEYMIIGSKVACYIQDSPYFMTSPYNSIVSLNSHRYLYKIGTIFNINVYVDPYIKYNDNRISLLNDINFNIGNISSFYINEEMLLQKIYLKWGITYKDSVSKLLYLIDDKHDKTYSLYKQGIRQEKINNLLNGEE